LDFLVISVALHPVMEAVEQGAQLRLAQIFLLKPEVVVVAEVPKRLEDQCSLPRQ
jgi:hypothetical protein